MLLIDLEQGRIIEDEEIKRDLAEAAPYEEWLKQTQYKLEELPAVVEGADAPPANDPSLLLDRQQAFGYTQEAVSRFLEPKIGSASGRERGGQYVEITVVAVALKKK